MIKSTEKYKAAIIGDTRRIYLRAIVDITDPDVAYLPFTSSSEAEWSQQEQTHDRVFEMDAPYSTLERNRWILDGSTILIPKNYKTIEHQVGFVGNDISRDDCTFSPSAWVQINLDNVGVLQAVSLYFSDRDIDGYPVDFTVEVIQGGTTYFSKSFTGNTERILRLHKFKVYDPDAIRITFTKWSLPGRRVRIAEVIPGLYEEWGNDEIATFDVKHQGSFSSLELPYGTCTLSMDNLDKDFEPRNKLGVFEMLEDRQGIDVLIGVQLDNNTIEYKRVGMFYQYSNGWKTSNNNITMTWNLVDIVGLLARREFVPPSTLPTTLAGWMQAIVSQLGDNFTERYTVDENFANYPLTVNNAKDVVGITCGDLMRFVCMASGTWVRADAETGYLAAEPLWSQGNKITLDNIKSYPVMQANSDIAAIIFTLADGNDTQFVVSGNTTASDVTKSVKNPFIHTQEQALTAAKLILSMYGGNVIQTTGRGDPSSEIGDVATIELDESNAVTGRLRMQTFSLQEGVLQGCASDFVQADGAFLFEAWELITESGTWTAPTGKSKLRIIVCGGGSGGENGKDGTWDNAGANGADGIGGKIYAATININEQQSFSVSIGKGGAAGKAGTDTIFGAYTSENGEYFSPSYTDIASGNAYGRTGVAKPLNGTGDGGKGGKGGVKGNMHDETSVDNEGNEYSYTVIDNYPGEGEAGTTGADGFVLVYYEKD